MCVPMERQGSSWPWSHLGDRIRAKGINGAEEGFVGEANLELDLEGPVE